MLNSSSSDTVFALRKLRQTIEKGRPIVWWIGAGASRWAGFESWKDLARRMRSRFNKLQNNFDNSTAKALVNSGSYPELFQICKYASLQEYYRFLVDAFRPTTRTPAYSRFISKISEVSPLFLLTTNVDEELEKNIPGTVLIQSTDFGRVEGELQQKNSFILKLHGSISSDKSMVFAKEDYDSLLANPSYRHALRTIFYGTSVVFLGYGVRDQYVLRLLKEDAQAQQLFGAGPHFVVKPPGQDSPSELLPIEYQIDHFGDHSAAIAVLDVYLQAQSLSISSEEVQNPSTAFEAPQEKTAYYISDFMPPGTWLTAHIAGAQRPGEKEIVEVTAGLGYTNDEIPFRVSTAFHDLLVGLICFDYVYLPLNALQQVVQSLGEARVRNLVDSEVLRFIDVSRDLAAIFSKGEVIGSLGDMTLQDPNSTGPRTVHEKIRRVLNPVPGKEDLAEIFMEGIERKVSIFAPGPQISMASKTRDALLMPRIPSLLGISDAMLPGQLPRWLIFPYLRLGHLVQTGVICAEFGIQAAKLPFGGQALTTAAFGLSVAPKTADHVASYVLSGRFNTDIGAFVVQEPAVVDRAIQFRSTAASESLRLQIKEALLSDSPSGFTASVNAGLSQTVPQEVLDQARDGMSILFTESSRLTATPAIWTNEWQSDGITRYWRDKSRAILLQLCAERKIRKDDPCICGSGDELRDCCLRSLHT